MRLAHCVRSQCHLIIYKRLEYGASFCCRSLERRIEVECIDRVHNYIVVVSVVGYIAAKGRSTSPVLVVASRKRSRRNKPAVQFRKILQGNVTQSDKKLNGKVFHACTPAPYSIMVTVSLTVHSCMSALCVKLHQLITILAATTCYINSRSSCKDCCVQKLLYPA